MITVDDIISKMTTDITINGNLRIAQKTLLDACGTTPAAAAKRALQILEDSSLRQFMVGTYPKVTLTTNEIKVAPSIKDIHKKLLTYKAYIVYAVPALGTYIPKETVEVLKDHLVAEDPLSFIAVTTFATVIAALHQAGNL